MVLWTCISHCGACCHLDPSNRPGLDDYLSAEELGVYLKLIGEDGWCIHFQREQRTCGIYEHRPTFCRVTPSHFEQRYGVPKSEFDEFAIACCCEQITGVYGEDSHEMKQYEQQIVESA